MATPLYPERLPPKKFFVTLYQENISEILSKIPANFQIEIEANGLLFDNVEEFFSYEKKIKDVRIRVSNVNNDKLYINFISGEAKLDFMFGVSLLENDSRIAIKNLHKFIVSYFVIRQRITRFFYNEYFLLAACILCIVAASLYNDFYLKMNITIFSFIGGFFISNFFMVLWITKKLFPSYVNHPSLGQGWWQKHRDKLLIGIIVGTTSTLIAALILSLFTNAPPKS